MPAWGFGALGGAALAAVVLWIYAPALHGAWLWDDGLEVAGNPLMRQSSGWWLPWVRPAGLDYFPLKDSLLWLEWQCGRGSPLTFHLTSVALQLLNSLLLWRVLDRLTASAAGTTVPVAKSIDLMPTDRGQASKKQAEKNSAEAAGREESGVERDLRAPWLWLGALFFAVHPAAVESVAWIAEQKTLWSLAGVLGSLLAFFRFEATRSRGAYVAALAAFGAALLCKTAVVMFPLWLVVYLLWRRPFAPGPGVQPEGTEATKMPAVTGVTEVMPVVAASGARPPGALRARSAQSALIIVAPFVALATILGGVTIGFQETRAIRLHGSLPMPELSHRAAAAGWSLWAYLQTAFLPLHLAPVYPDWNRPAWATALVGLGWVVLLGIGIWAARKGGLAAQILILAAAWFLLNLLPALGFIPMAYLRIAPRADHFLYGSLPAVAGLAAAGLAWRGGARSPSVLGESRLRSAAKETDARRVLNVPDTLRQGFGGRGGRVAPWLAAAVAAVAVVLLAWTSRAQAHWYQNESSLWQAAVSRNPDSWFVLNNWGKVLLERGELAVAAECFRGAAQRQPASAEVWANLGNADAALGRSAAALADYRRAVSADPAFAGAHYDLGRALLTAGDYSSSVQELSGAVRLDPAHAAAHNLLGLALSHLGRPAEALTEYRQALRLDPAAAETHVNLGNAYFRSGQTGAAAAEYRAALALNPHYAAAHRNLAALLLAEGDAANARQELEAARADGLPP